MSRTVKLTATVLAVVLVFALVAAGMSMYFIAPVDSPDNAVMVSFYIPTGTSASRVGKMLEEEGLIKSYQAFRALNLVFRFGSKIKAGSYVLSSSDNMMKIVRKLMDGQIISVKVTVPEGMTLTQVAQIMERNGLCDGEEFEALALEPPDRIIDILGMDLGEKGLEGFLFPDTYEFSKGCGAEAVIEKMVSRFVYMTRDLLTQGERDHRLSEYELVTLASIVEKEAKLSEDRPRIAQVFLNRLDVDMMLQSCATIQYLLPTPKEKLLNKDLEIESEYNTYKNLGLPPGPICSPGYDSIKACVYPSGEDYLYFVATESGSHIFSRTYEQHIRAQRSLNN